MIKYIYRITFQSGKTYIGQRTYKGENVYDDSYMGSSRYKKNNPDDKVVKKEIIISGNFDNFTLNLLETDSIIFEKMQRGNNCVNGTYGGLFYSFLPRIKGIYKPSEQSKEKNRLAHLNTPDYVKNKIANTVSKLWENPDYRNNQSNSHKGKKSHLGFKNTPEQIKHLSESHKGIKQSEECKMKLKQNMYIRMAKMKELYSDYKINNPNIKWNDFLSKYSKGELYGRRGGF